MAGAGGLHFVSSLLMMGAWLLDTRPIIVMDSWRGLCLKVGMLLKGRRVKGVISRVEEIGLHKVIKKNVIF